MDFKHEYKRSAEMLSPDSDTVDRMKQQVLTKASEKKTFPFRKVAYIGGAVAACALITVSAVTLLPKTDSSYVAEETLNTASKSYADLTDRSPMDDAAAEEVMSVPAADTTPVHREEGALVPEADSAIPESVLESEDAEPEEASGGVQGANDADNNAMQSSATSKPAEDSTDAAPIEAPANDETDIPEDEVVEETLQALATEEVTVVTTDAPPQYEDISFSENADSCTFNGIMLVLLERSASVPEGSVEILACNSASGKLYLVYPADGCYIICDIDGTIIGCYAEE